MGGGSSWTGTAAGSGIGAGAGGSGQPYFVNTKEGTFTVYDWDSSHSVVPGNYRPENSKLATGGFSASKIAKIGAGSLVGGAMGYLTADTTHKDATGQTVTNSKEAQTLSTVLSTTSGAASGILSAIGLPWAGVLVQTLTGVLTPIFTKWIDAERDARNLRVDTANKILNSLDSIKDTTENIADYTKESYLNYDNFTELKEQISSLVTTLKSEDNKDLVNSIWSNLQTEYGNATGGVEINGQTYTSLWQYLDKILNSDAETREVL